MSGVLAHQRVVSVNPVVGSGSSSTRASRSRPAARITQRSNISSNKGSTTARRGFLGGGSWGGAGKSPTSSDPLSKNNNRNADVACAATAQGPHAVTVPLPSSGPLTPPADVAAAVAQWPWRGGLEPCGDVPVAALPPAAIEVGGCTRLQVEFDERCLLFRQGATTQMQWTHSA
jgi:hypothetical protein